MKEIAIYRDNGSVDPRLINEFEQMTGYRLPKTYRELLAAHDALWPERRVFNFIDRSSGEPVNRDVTFYGFGEGVFEDEQICLMQEHDVYGHEGVVTIGCAANGDYIGFDYRGKLDDAEPAVVVMFHDVADTEGKMLVNFVASTFDAFIDILYKPAGDDAEHHD
ncbi:SMI1/KNR4 family protein [Massilia genomosp. 1]|uniref:Knr4/Smi1-like domain-containing protein n=1 Tax=Massilia genomosp. 1 TaxID=2609280 RepID=A0ABX0MKH3_9BURK|nr:SMI1/KNR4 family protein [Massilia genomosp. 1]NHZ63287.1 hypothetical protein [Massilia genomosp. 1]